MKKFVQAILIVTMLCATSAAEMAAAATTTTATTTASTCPSPKVLLKGSCVACPAGAEYRLGKDKTGIVDSVLCVTKTSCPTGTTLDATKGGCISTTTPCPAGANNVINGNVCIAPVAVTVPSCQTGSYVNGECVSCPTGTGLVVSGSIAKCSKDVLGKEPTCKAGFLYSERECFSCPSGTTLSRASGKPLCVADPEKKNEQLTCPAEATLVYGKGCVTCPAGLTAVRGSSSAFSPAACEKSVDILPKPTCSTGTFSNGKCVQPCPAGMSPVESATTAGLFSCQSTATSCPAGTTFVGLRCSTTATCPQNTTLSGNECLGAASKQ